MEKDRMIDNIQRQNNELRDNYQTIETNFQQIEHHNDNYKQDINSLKRDNQTLSQNLDECNNKSNFVLNEMNERVKILSVENEKLSEESNRLKSKLNQLFGEIKSKDEKLITNLKDETVYVENKLSKDIKDLKVENDSLMRQRLELRIIANDAKFEAQKYKEQLQQQEMNNSKLSTSFENSPMFPSRGKMNKKKGTQPTTGVTSFSKNETGETMMNYLSSEGNFQRDNKEIKNIQKENARLNTQIEELSAKVAGLEKVLRGSQIEFQAADIERGRFKNMVDKLEGENHDLRRDIDRLKESLKDVDKVESLLGEIKEKNQTINYLIEECDKVKANNHESMNELERRLQEKEEELGRLSEEKYKHNKELKNMEKKHNDILKENKILLQDIENQNKDLNDLHRDKLDIQYDFDNKIKGYDDFTSKMKNEYERMKAENQGMKKDMKDLLNSSFHNYDILMERLTKSKKKRDRLIAIYEAHLELLKQRFTQQIKEITHVYNMKVAEKDQINMERYLGAFEALREKHFDTSLYEATIESYKKENKQNKHAKDTLSTQVKKLTREVEELRELCNVKNLQMKLKKPTKSSNEGQIDEKVSTADHDFIVRLLELEKVLYENSVIKVEDNDITSKINLLLI